MGIKVVVMRTEGIKNIPDSRKRGAFVQCLFRAGALRDNNGNDDIAILLFVNLSSMKRTHHTPYTLHHVYLRVTCGEKEHGIQSRDVYTLG